MRDESEPSSKRRTAERAAELYLIEPTVKAIAVKDVAAVEASDLLPAPHRRQAHHAVFSCLLLVGIVGEGAIRVQEVSEDDEAGRWRRQ